MKILYAENPLRSVIQLDDRDRAELRLRTRIQLLEEAVTGATIYLEEGGQFFDIDKARKELQGASDEALEWRLRFYESELDASHCGDCTCVPASCGKCAAEHALGVNTIDGLRKHEASKIDSAFRRGLTIHQVIEDLANYDAERSAGANAWKERNPDGWAACLPRWKEEAERAHAWLIRYRDAHFPA